MTAIVVRTPRLLVLPGMGGARPAVDAAAGMYQNLSGTLAMADLGISPDELETTTSEDEGWKSHVPGLKDFSASVTFRKGEVDRDWSILNENRDNLSLFCVYRNNEAISARNLAIMWLGYVFELPFPVTIGEASEFTATFKHGEGGVIVANAAAGLTEGGLPYESIPVT